MSCLRRQLGAGLGAALQGHLAPAAGRRSTRGAAAPAALDGRGRLLILQPARHHPAYVAPAHVAGDVSQRSGTGLRARVSVNWSGYDYLRREALVEHRLGFRAPQAATSAGTALLRAGGRTGTANRHRPRATVSWLRASYPRPMVCDSGTVVDGGCSGLKKVGGAVVRLDAGVTWLTGRCCGRRCSSGMAASSRQTGSRSADCACWRSWSAAWSWHTTAVVA